MEFYKDCFGGELSMQLVGESPMAGQWPTSTQQHVLHAELRHQHLVVLGSDMGLASQKVAGNAISLALVCSSKKEIAHFFEKLSLGGKVTHPVHSFFDGCIAALSDRYGVNWILKY